MADQDLWRSLAPPSYDSYIMNCDEAALLHNMIVVQFSFERDSFIHRIMFPVHSRDDKSCIRVMGDIYLNRLCYLILYIIWWY
jgi:hypothetical protein